MVNARSLDETNTKNNVMNKKNTLFSKYDDVRESSVSRAAEEELAQKKNLGSFCEILQVAQVNLENAVLAIKHYEIVAWDISSMVDIEEKIIITRAKQLCRQTEVFDKMTESALIKLNVPATNDSNSDILYFSDSEETQC